MKRGFQTLAVLAFALGLYCLAPINNPPGGTGATGPAGPSGSPGPQGSPGPAATGGEFELNPGGTVIDLNSITAQDVYTVPAGKALIVTKVIWHSASTAFNGGSTTSVQVISSNGATLISFLNTEDGDAGEYLIGVAGNASPVIAATEKVQAKPSIAFGSAETAKVVVFGYQLDV